MRARHLIQNYCEEKSLLASLENPLEHYEHIASNYASSCYIYMVWDTVNTYCDKELN